MRLRGVPGFSRNEEGKGEEVGMAFFEVYLRLCASLVQVRVLGCSQALGGALQLSVTRTSEPMASDGA